MSQIEWKDFACRSVVVMALAGAIALGSADGNAQTAAPQRRESVTVPPTPELNSASQPALNPYEQFIDKPSRQKKDSAASPKKAKGNWIDLDKLPVDPPPIEKAPAAALNESKLTQKKPSGEESKTSETDWSKFKVIESQQPASDSETEIQKRVKDDSPVGLFDDLLKPQADDDTNRTARITNTSLLGVFGVVGLSVLLALVCAYILWNLLGKGVQGSSPVATGRRWMNWVVMIACIQPLTRFFSQLINGHGNPGNILAQGVAGTIVLAVIAFGAGATSAYVRNRKSKDAALPVEPPSATPDTAHGNSVTPAPVNEPASFAAVPQEESWSSALAEFDSPARRPGLWARAFAEAQGNEAAAKANYLRYRASELEEVHQLQIAERQRELVQEEAQRMREVQEAQAEEARRVYDAVPKGTCPNQRCKAVIPLSSQECPKCGAFFEAGSPWSVQPLET